MSEDQLSPLLAMIGTNDGANRGFWRIQPRDKYGQWMEMGRGTLFKIRIRGRLIAATIHGVYVGPAGKPGKGRILVQGQDDKGIKSGVYEVDSNNMEQFEGLIPKEYLEKQGLSTGPKKDIFGNEINELADNEVPYVDEIPRTDITPEDERLAKGELTEEERAAEKAGREESPIAKMPGGYETTNPEETKKLLEESGVNPDDFAGGEKKAPEAPTAEAPAKAPAKAKTEKAKKPKRIVVASKNWLENVEEGDELFLSMPRTGKLVQAHVRGDGYLYEGRYIESEQDEEGRPLGSPYELIDSIDSGRGPGAYKGTIPTQENGITPVTPDEFRKLRQDQWAAESEAKKAKALEKATAKAFEKASAGEDVNVDQVLNDALDFDPDEIVFDEDAAPDATPAAEVTPEAPATPEKPKRAPKAKVEKAAKPEKKPKVVASEEDDNPEEVDPATVATFTGPEQEVRDKISSEELAKMAKPEDWTEDFGFEPSQEQSDIAAAIVLADKDTAVLAGAGAGKTTVFVAITKALKRLKPEARVLYLQFNRKNANEAKTKVPDNTLANTTASQFGYKFLRSAFGKDSRAMGARYRSIETFHKSGANAIAKFLELDDINIKGKNQGPAAHGQLVINAVENYSNSADEKIGPQHVNFDHINGPDMTPEDEAKAKAKIVESANKYWEDLTSVPVWEKVQAKNEDGVKLFDEKGDPIYEQSIDKKTGQPAVDAQGNPKPKMAVVKGATAISPAVATKMWTLTNPNIADFKHNGRPITHVFMDEAQDTVPAIEKVLMDNVRAGNIKLSMVGDNAQSIYRFMGAENAIGRYSDGLSEAALNLSTTRRFGTKISTAANSLLNLLGEKYRLKSTNEGYGEGEILTSDNIDGLDGTTAVVVRNNMGGFAQMKKFLDRGKKVAVTSVLKQDVDDALENLKWILEDKDSRDKQPSVVHPDLKDIYSKESLFAEMNRNPTGKAAYWARLVTKFEEDLKPLESIMSRVIVQPERHIDLADITNLSAADGDSGEFAGIKWEVYGNKLILDGNLDAELTGLKGATFRDLVIGGKNNGSGNSFSKNDPSILKPDGDLPTWRTKRNADGNTKYELVIDEDSDRELYLNNIANLFKLDTGDTEDFDVLVTTAHRAKGLEWDNIIIGDDFGSPKVTDPETGAVAFPDDQELDLAYVALTRAKKRLFMGSLKWTENYQGKDGLARANKEMQREPDFNMDVVDSEEKKQSQILEQTAAKEAAIPKEDRVLNALYAMDDNGEISFDTDVPETAPVAKSGPGGDKRTHKFLKDWIEQLSTPGGYTGVFGGNRWNIKENKDGSITLRARSNEDVLGSRVYKNYDELAADFPALVSRGKEVNKDRLKKIVGPADKDGSIAKMIEDGASGEEIFDALNATGDLIDAIENGQINELALEHGLRRYNSGNKVKRLVPKRTRKISSKKTATPQPPANEPSALWKAVPEDRRDDGTSNIGRNENIQEVLDKWGGGSGDASKDIKLILEKIVPGAKVQEDGSVTYYRETFLDEFGPGAGDEHTLELSFKEAKNNSWRVKVKVTNTETGESQEYWHYSAHKSLKSLFGEPGKSTAGLESLISKITRDPAKTKYKSNPKEDKKYRENYGGIIGEIELLRAGRYDRLLQMAKLGLGKSDTTLKLRTPEEETSLALYGRAQVTHTDGKNFLRQKRSEVGSILESLDSGDYAEARSLLATHLRSLPDTQAARDTARDVLRGIMEQRYVNSSKRELDQMMEQFNGYLDSNMPAQDDITTHRPHTDKNGQDLQVGDRVIIKNNVGETAVGTVVRKLKEHTPSINSGEGEEGEEGDEEQQSYVYGDYVKVEFANGSVLPMASKKMTKTAPDTKPTSSAPWLYEDDLTFFRAEQQPDKYRVDRASGQIFDLDTNTVIYKGVGTESYGQTEVAENLAENQKIYNDTGDLLGQVVGKPKSGTARDGSRVTAVKYRIPGGNGATDTLVVKEGSKVNTSPLKPEVSNRDAIPSPAATTDVAKRAAALGISSGQQGRKPSKTISKNSADNTPENAEAIKPISGKNVENTWAVAPTEEATNIKNEVVAMGEEVWSGVPERMKDILRQKGYDIPDDATYDDIARAALDSLAKVGNDYAVARRAALDLEENTINGIKDSKSGVSGVFNEMRAAGYVKTEDGKEVIDVAKLSKDLRKAGVKGLPYYLEDEDSDFSAKKPMLAFAYKALTDPAVTEEAKKVYFDQYSKDKAQERAKATDYLDDVHQAERVAAKEALEAAGVQFDNVSLDEFDGLLVTAGKKAPLNSKSTIKAAEALSEAFKHMPRSNILKMIEHLKENNLKLEVKAGVKRGHFAPLKNGKGYEIHLSNRRGKDRRIAAKEEGLNPATDVALHELTHFTQKLDPNQRAIEHAWLYDRAVVDAGTDNERLVPIINLNKGGSEQALAIKGMSQPYMAKAYPFLNRKAFLNPNDEASEVSTMAMQDLFTNPGIASGAYGLSVMGLDPETGEDRLYPGAFYDPETGKYYRSSSKKTEIEGIKGVFGRNRDEGTDFNVKHLATGMLLALNDWSPTEGFGPGNAVVPNEEK
jgi:superfamily I DNA/RNA helicase